MQLTKTESTFLNMIKLSCIEKSVKEKITPSVIAALAIVESNWGTTKKFYKTRNIYHLQADSTWFGKCYSKKSGIIYDKINDCTETGIILYRVYDDHEDSIFDFIDYIISDRRSKDGPLKYSSIIGCTEYKETIDMLMRADFMQSYLNRSDTINYTNNLISVIEKYELYKWDDDLKLSLQIDETDVDNEEILEDAVSSTEQFDHIYHVRLEWDKPDTRIFTGPIYEDAKECALKHEGYKIFIDDGELFEDPWFRVEEIVDDLNPNIRLVTHPLAGRPIELNNTPVYNTARAKHPFKYLTGTFYFYDYSIINGRAKITIYKDIKKADPSLILGYINI